MNYEYCDGMTHTVKQGETLYSLSRQHNVPLAILLRANPYIDVYNLQVGDTICVPVKRTRKCGGAGCGNKAHGGMGILPGDGESQVNMPQESTGTDAGMDSGMSQEMDTDAGIGISIGTGNNAGMDIDAGTDSSNGTDMGNGMADSTADGINMDMNGTIGSGMDINIPDNDNEDNIMYGGYAAGIKHFTDNRRTDGEIGSGSGTDMSGRNSNAMEGMPGMSGRNSNAMAGMPGRGIQDNCWIKYVAQSGDTLQDIFDRSACSKEMFWEKNPADRMYMLPGVAYFILEKNVE